MYVCRTIFIHFLHYTNISSMLKLPFLCDARSRNVSFADAEGLPITTLTRLKTFPPLVELGLYDDHDGTCILNVCYPCRDVPDRGSPNCKYGICMRRLFRGSMLQEYRIYVFHDLLSAPTWEQWSTSLRHRGIASVAIVYLVIKPCVLSIIINVTRRTG